MRATLHAMALAALAPHGKVNLADMQRAHAHVKEMSLFGKAHYLLALTQVADTADMQAEVVDMMRAHANETSGKFVFSEEVDVAYQRLLYSSLRTNCAILSALVAYDTTQHGGTTTQRCAVEAGAQHRPDTPESDALAQHAGKHLLYERLDRLQPRLRA